MKWWKRVYVRLVLKRGFVTFITLCETENEAFIYSGSVDKRLYIYLFSGIYMPNHLTWPIVLYFNAGNTSLGIREPTMPTVFECWKTHGFSFYWIEVWTWFPLISNVISYLEAMFLCLAWLPLCFGISNLAHQRQAFRIFVIQFLPLLLIAELKWN